MLFSCAPLSLSPLAGWARKVVGGLGARHARLVLLGELGVAPPQRLRLAELVLGGGVLLAQVRPLDLRAVGRSASVRLREGSELRKPAR